ncbi:MAG: acyl-[Muribaculaceae bacterium]|nr:acyl-[acyl-carrier-protein]--UDP-N-acetylglucosamine O-acyltransferase [Muribaculaceae bacterium]
MEAKLYCVHPDAKIGENVEIGNFTTIHEDVEIGDNTIIGSNVTIFPGARIGKNVTIFPGAVVSGMPQDLKYRGEKTYAYVGDNTVIRECVTIHRGTASRGKTVVGSNCLIMAYSHVAH